MPRRKALIKGAAFLCRYGHQSFNEVMNLPMATFNDLIIEITDIVNGEQVRMEGD